MTEVNKRYPLPTPTHTHKPKNEKRRRRKNICNEVSKELEEKTYIILQCFDETIKRAFVSRISHHSWLNLPIAEPLKQLIRLS